MAHPSLLNSCAYAATAAEARFRIDYPLAASRATRVVALDPEAERVVGEVAAGEWFDTEFYRPASPGAQNLASLDGASVRSLTQVLTGADALLMVSASDASEAAAAIGAACTVRGIMTAGLVLDSGHVTNGALVALRPHARVLLVPADRDDLFEFLKAIRA